VPGSPYDLIERVPRIVRWRRGRTTLEKLLASKITGLSARRHGSKRVVVGFRELLTPAGKAQKIVVPLNGTGRKLLARFKRLPATLTVSLLTPTGRR
jgi:hypothetical protein